MFNPSHVFQLVSVTIMRCGCCSLLIASGLVVKTPQADAAGPDLLDYFHACGIGDDAFAVDSQFHLRDGRRTHVVRGIEIDRSNFLESAMNTGSLALPRR